MSFVRLSFKKPLEDRRGCWQKSVSHKHTPSTDVVDAAKLSAAALTAGSAEEGRQSEREGRTKREEGGKMKEG